MTFASLIITCLSSLGQPHVGEGPSEVEAEQRSPNKHRDPREVEGVAQPLAEHLRNRKEELVGAWPVDGVHLDVVADGEEEGGGQDAEEVGGKETAAEIF